MVAPFLRELAEVKETHSFDLPSSQKIASLAYPLGIPMPLWIGFWASHAICMAICFASEEVSAHFCQTPSHPDETSVASTGKRQACQFCAESRSLAYDFLAPKSMFCRGGEAITFLGEMVHDEKKT